VGLIILALGQKNVVVNNRENSNEYSRCLTCGKFVD